MTDTTTLPTWDDMTDVDKGCALMHLWKREWEGACYAVEHYPARYLDHPALVALDPRAASKHAAFLWRSVDALDSAESERLYNLALDEPDRRRLWGVRSVEDHVYPVDTETEA